MGLRANSPAAHSHICYWTSFRNQLFQQLLDIRNAELTEGQAHDNLEGITLDTDSENEEFFTPTLSPIITHRSIEIQTDLSLTDTHLEVDLDFSLPHFYIELNPET